jgi:hypothetical protein
VCPQPLVSGHFAVDQAESIVLTQSLNEEPLRFPLHLWYSPTALSHCATISRAIYHITSGAAAKAWCGTVLVLKLTELENRATLMQGRMITQLFQPISWLTSTFFPEMNPVPLINHPCTVCFRSTSMWCNRCQSSWYCTPGHLQSVSLYDTRVAET